MKFGEYLEHLVLLLNENPELANADVVYAVDDEGNDFGIVNWVPSIGYFDKHERDFIPEDSIDEDEEDMCVNAVLIN
mgnify:CR=1 FL=1